MVMLIGLDGERYETIATRLGVPLGRFGRAFPAVAGGCES